MSENDEDLAELDLTDEQRKVLMDAMLKLLKSYGAVNVLGMVVSILTTVSPNETRHLLATWITYIDKQVN